MLTAERLREVVSYDEGTGYFHWRRPRHGLPPLPAGTLTPNGYVRFNVDGHYYMAHRLAWLYLHGELPTAASIDHINGQRADNRIANLRLATRSQQAANRSAMKRNKLGIKNVSRRNGRFAAYIRKDGKLSWLGTYDTPEEAQAVSRAASEKLYGDFCEHLSRDSAAKELLTTG